MKLAPKSILLAFGQMRFSFYLSGNTEHMYQASQWVVEGNIIVVVGMDTVLRIKFMTVVDPAMIYQYKRENNYDLHDTSYCINKIFCQTGTCTYLNSCIGTLFFFLLY